MAHPPELTADTIEGLLWLRERLGVPAYALDRDEWFGDPVAQWFPELAALSTVRAAADNLLSQLDRTLHTLARQRHESLILTEDFGGGVSVIDGPAGSRPFVFGPVNRLPGDHPARSLLPSSELYAGHSLILGPAKPVGVVNSAAAAYRNVPLAQVPGFVPRTWGWYSWYGSSRAAELTREMEARRRAKEEADRHTAQLLQEQAEARQRAEQEADPKYAIRRLQEELAALKAARE
jgi:hypothetical protein